MKEKALFDEIKRRGIWPQDFFKWYITENASLSLREVDEIARLSADQVARLVEKDPVSAKAFYGNKDTIPIVTRSSRDQEKLKVLEERSGLGKSRPRRSEVTLIMQEELNKAVGILLDPEFEWLDELSEKLPKTNVTDLTNFRALDPDSDKKQLLEIVAKMIAGSPDLDFCVEIRRAAKASKDTRERYDGKKPSLKSKVEEVLKRLA